MLVCKLFDRFDLAGWIDGRAEKEKGFFRPGLMTEVWIALPLYGGGVIDDLPLLDRPGVRRNLGLPVAVPDRRISGPHPLDSRGLAPAGPRPVALS